MTKRATVVIAAVLLVAAVLGAGAGGFVAFGDMPVIGAEAKELDRGWPRTEEDVYFCEGTGLYFCKRTHETVWPSSEPGIWTSDISWTVPEGIRLDDLRGKTMYEVNRLTMPAEVWARIPLWVQERWHTIVLPARSSEPGAAVETEAQPLF